MTVPDVGTTRLYALTDAAGSTTSIVGNAGGAWRVVERYLYDQDGRADAVNPDWSAYMRWDQNPAASYGASRFGWDMLYEGMRLRQVHADMSNTFGPEGLYEGSGGTWYDPQHGRTLQPDWSAFSAPVDPYDPNMGAYTDKLGIAGLTWLTGSSFFSVSSGFMDAMDAVREVGAPVVTLGSLFVAPETAPLFAAYTFGTAAALKMGRTPTPAGSAFPPASSYQPVVKVHFPR